MYQYRLLILTCFALTEVASAQQTFGRSGRDGENGYSGDSGRDGHHATISATGNSERINLSGENGRDGRDGVRGYRATDCYQGTPDANLQGARGGDGGQGGSGGRGGHGGNLTIYYDQTENLRQIQANLEGGRGAYAGRGADGADGCRCTTYQWKGSNDQTYTCRDGRRGNYGRDGAHGSDGRMGALRLIDQLTPIEEDVTQRRASLVDIGQGPFVFGRNQWQQMRGARSLLANGSRVQDAYLAYQGRVVKQYIFSWEVERAIEDFSNVDLYMSMNGANDLSWDHTAGFWHRNVNVADDEGNIHSTFTAAVHQSEAFDFSFARAYGSGTGLVVEIEDRSGFTEAFDHELRIDYKTKARVFYYRRYAGEIPSALVEVQPGRLVIKVGELPIDEAYLRTGLATLIQIQVTRKMGNHSGYKWVSDYHTIE